MNRSVVKEIEKDEEKVVGTVEKTVLAVPKIEMLLTTTK